MTMLGEDLVALHFAKQQQYMRRNTQTIDSDDAWFAAAARIRQSCGALVLWRQKNCAGSRFLAPVLYEMSVDNEKAPILFFEVNVDVCRRAKAENNIDLTPAFTTFFHGKPVAGSHGISKHFIQDQFENLCCQIETCSQCGRSNRLAFMNDLETAIATGCLGRGQSLTVSNTRVPSRRCALDLDLNGYPEGFAEFRLAHLLEKLSADTQSYPECWQICNSRYVIEFLEEKDDEALHVDDLIDEVQAWLTQKYDDLHPSLWDADQYGMRARIVRHAIYRRAARVEAWLLLNLLRTSSGSKTTEANDRRVRQEVGMKLEALQWKVPCPKQCRQCRLPCGRLRSHEGSCDCRTDHRCHCANAHGQCDLPAGHGNAHSFPQPPPPPPPPPQAVASSVSLPSLQSSLASAGRLSVHSGSAFTPKLTIDQLRNSWTGTCKESTCSICFEPMDPSSIEELYCKHAFHPACIGSWAREKRSCPMCRFPVDVSKFLAAPSSSLPVVQTTLNGTETLGTPGRGANAPSRPRVSRGNDTRRRSNSTSSQVQRAQQLHRSRTRP